MSHHSHIGLGHPNDTVGIKVYNGDINCYNHDTVLKKKLLHYFYQKSIYMHTKTISTALNAHTLLYTHIIIYTCTLYTHAHYIHMHMHMNTHNAQCH